MVITVIELKAKDFSTRSRLEAKVGSLMGLTADPKPDYVITGTAAELKNLHLGHGSIFWGIRVEETDFVEPPKLEKVDRGKIHKSKLESVDIDKSEELGTVSKKPRSIKKGKK